MVLHAHLISLERILSDLGEHPSSCEVRALGIFPANCRAVLTDRMACLDGSKRGLAVHRSRPTCRSVTGCQLTAVSLAFHCCLTPEADLSLLRGRLTYSVEGLPGSVHRRPAAALLVFPAGAAGTSLLTERLYREASLMVGSRGIPTLQGFLRVAA